MRAAKLTMVLLVSVGLTGLASDFLMEGVDTERTGWVRDERVFTPANVGTLKEAWSYASQGSAPIVIRTASDRIELTASRELR